MSHYLHLSQNLGLYGRLYALQEAGVEGSCISDCIGRGSRIALGLFSFISFLFLCSGKEKCLKRNPGNRIYWKMFSLVNEQKHWKQLAQKQDTKTWRVGGGEGGSEPKQLPQCQLPVCHGRECLSNGPGLLILCNCRNSHPCLHHIGVKQPSSEGRGDGIKKIPLLRSKFILTVILCRFPATGPILERVRGGGGGKNVLWPIPVLPGTQLVCSESGSHTLVHTDLHSYKRIHSYHTFCTCYNPDVVSFTIK